MKKWIWMALFACVICTLYGFKDGERAMRLVHKPTGFLIVEFRGEEIQFHDPSLEDEMREIGIYIPEHLRAQYGNQEVILLGDAHFASAFQEIYYKQVYDTRTHLWE